MRSQHSELSTNQKPPFRQNSWCWPNLESTNHMPICQLNVNWFLKIELHLRILYSGTWLYRGKWPSKTIIDEPIQCQCRAYLNNWIHVSIVQWNVNWQPMECQWYTNWLHIVQLHLRILYSGTCLYRGKWPSKTIIDEPIQCQSLPNQNNWIHVSIVQWNVNWQQMECQWTTNGIPIDFI